MARATPVLYQSERSECGLVCLAMMAGAHGLQHDLASLRARYPVSLKGSTLTGLVGIARDLALETRALRCEIEDFDQVRLPAMLHWRMTHCKRRFDHTLNIRTVIDESRIQF